MVVKNQIKFIKSLQQKKYRTQSGLFVVEGVKLVNELLNAGFSAHKLYTTQENLLKSEGVEVCVISESTLKRMSGLKTPNKVLGVFDIPKSQPLDYTDWVLALDDIRDPGNLGTIIRLCDWFGFSCLLCSPNTVDCYNPKTLQATMGSIARVNVKYDSIETAARNSGLPVYGTFMEGEAVCDHSFPQSGIVVMGNESHGLSKNLQGILDHKISIPQFGNSGIESLNVAMATAIVLHEIRRNPIQK